ncbi:very short patch repair endonuclease [Paenibacillus amylolyticus]|uniref:Very short patch repair endonuclease n=1 Tax=Paenibacillus amylolyticus TaxID=1451 RepID=A0A5M9WUU1_PAEAM|nr:very short patch repair endonuclease [Paenibacillus amylolyticus]KAA8785447.1 very short patch repair endonuclease [Paenibacillus amylolyticus]
MKTPEEIHKMMSSIKGKNTKLELSVSKQLWHRGFRFRKNVKSLFGKPDIAIKKFKVVIFVDSCFWHGCKDHFKIPKKNPDYWLKKINRNIQRDQEVTDYYKGEKWNIIRIWEHDLKSNSAVIIEDIRNFLIDCKNKL